jgi:hypothetical protein
MINNSTIINKTSNHHSSEHIKHKKRPWHIMMLSNGNDNEFEYNFLKICRYLNLVKIHRTILYNYCTLLIGRYCFPVLHKTSYCTRQSAVIVLLHFTMQNKTMFHHFCFGNFFYFFNLRWPFPGCVFFFTYYHWQICVLFWIASDIYFTL